MMMLIFLALSAFADDNDIQWKFRYAGQLYQEHLRHPTCQTTKKELLSDDRLMEKMANILLNLDQAAWLSTDDLRDANVLNKDRFHTYLTDTVDGKTAIHYVLEDDNGPMSAFYSEIKDGETTWPDPQRAPTTAPPTPTVPLPTSLEDDWACLKTALMVYQDPKVISHHPNPNHITMPLGEDTWVFLMPPVEDDNGRYLGGNVVFICKPDGKISLNEGFTDELMLNLADVDKPKNAQNAAQLISMPSSSTAVKPTHMMQTLMLGTPTVALTNGHIWLVTIDADNHYLGPIPATEKASKKKLKKLTKRKPGQTSCKD